MLGRRLFLRGDRCCCGGTLRGSARGEMRPGPVNIHPSMCGGGDLYIFVRHIALLWLLVAVGGVRGGELVVALNSRHKRSYPSLNSR